MPEKCEEVWSGLILTHYCTLTEPHTVHVCGEPGCACTYEPYGTHANDHTNGSGV